MQDESDTGDKNILEGVVQMWLIFIPFIWEKLKQGREFRSEDLQDENNEREARKRQYDQLIIQHKLVVWCNL